MVSISTFSTQQFTPFPSASQGTGGGSDEFFSQAEKASPANGRYPSDRVHISSPAGRRSPASENHPNDRSSADVAAEDEMSAEEVKLIQELQRRDREVRTHEQAHLAAAGQYASGGPSFTFQTGPNGKRYAVGGEVPISVSKESTPEETLQKMQIVSQAALAPLNPSPADRRIASRAAVIAAQARREIQAETLSAKAPEGENTPLAELSPKDSDESGNTVAIPVAETTLSPRYPAEDGNRRQMALKAYQRQNLH